MFCRCCGKEIVDEAVVCPQCGVWVKKESVLVEEQKKETNGIAVAGFVCSFFIPLLGWIFGGIGLSRANKRKGKGKGFSIASLAIASANFLIGLLIL